MYETFSIYEGRSLADTKARFSMARAEGWRPGMVKARKRIDKKSDRPGFFSKLFGAKPQPAKPVRNIHAIKSRLVNYSGLEQ